MPTNIVRRLKLDEYMAITKDENGQPVSANWVAKQVGSTHNTIMYYKEHYIKDLHEKGQIRQPSYMLVKALCHLFNVDEKVFVELEKEDKKSSEVVRGFAPAG